MVYMGSKNKYAKYIVPILQDIIDKNHITTYIEPFVGGANIIDKIKCPTRVGSDISDTLIALLLLAATDPEKILKDGNRELWDKGKAYVKDGIFPEDMSLADIGAMEFFASFSNGGFPRGYAKPTPTRNSFQEARRNLIAQAPYLKTINFICCDYRSNPYIALQQNSLIYCDPPYKNTKGYGYKRQGNFNHEEFWNWVRYISKHNIVIVSEQEAPNDFEVIWECEAKRTNGKDNNYKAVEKLFKWKGVN